MSTTNTDLSFSVVEITLIHGTKKHKVTVTPPTPTAEGGSDTESCVRHLAEAAYLATDVPVHLQKIIFKGKSLKTDSVQSLESLGIGNGAKVMIIGKKSTEDEHSKQFSKIDTLIKSTEKKQNEINKEVIGIEQGYLQTELVQDALKKLKKRLLACNEDYMKQLESIDSMNMDDAHQIIKNRRKKTVQHVQSLQDKLDLLTTRIDHLEIRQGDS